MSLSTALLASFVTCETARTIYAYHALHVSSKITPPLITLTSEFLKLIVAITFVSRSKTGFANLLGKNPQGRSKWSKCMRSAFPAALFLVNTLIFYTVLPLVSPTLLTVCILAKLPITAILYHFIVRKQRNLYAWTSLFWLCVGIVIFNIQTSNAQDETEVTGKTSWLIAPLAGLFIACIGSVASIHMEILTKAGEFWDSQFWLYTWGVVLAVVSYPVSATLYAMTKRNKVPIEVPFRDYVFPASALIVITGGTGLVVAVILRKRDNLLKLVGTSATLITTAAAQFILLPSLRATKIDFWSMLGGGLVVIMTYSYNFYQSQPWRKDNKAYHGLHKLEYNTETNYFNDEGMGIELLDRSSSDSSQSTLREIDPRPASESNGISRPDLTGGQKKAEGDLEASQDFDYDGVEHFEAHPLAMSTYFDPNATKITCLLLFATFLAIQTL